MIQKLEKEFVGIGDMKDFHFKQIEENEKGYVYQITHPISKTKHYEVVKKKLTKKLIDFKNRIYSETDFKEYYPGSKQFGKEVWCYFKLEKAKEKLKSLLD